MNTFIEVKCKYNNENLILINVAHISMIEDSNIVTPDHALLVTTHSYEELLEMIQKATPGVNRLKSK